MPSRWRRKKSEKKKKLDSPTKVPDGGINKIKPEAFHDHGDASHKAVASSNSSEPTKQTNADNSNPKMENSSSQKMDNCSNAKTENSSNPKVENNPHLPSHDSIGNGLVVQKNGRENGKLKGDAMVSEVQEFKQESNRCPECDDQLLDGKNDGELEEKSTIVEPLKGNQQKASSGNPSNDGSAVSDSGKETKEHSTSLTASGVTKGENAVSSEVPIKSLEAITETGKGEDKADDTGLPESEKEESRENVDKNALSSEILKSELSIKSPEAIVETGKGESTANDTRLLESEMEESRENVGNYGILDLVEPTKEEHKEIVPFPASVEVHHEDKQQVVVNTTSRTPEITENMDDYAHANSVKTPSEEIPEIVLFSSPVEVDRQANKPAITVDTADKHVALSSKDSEELKMTEAESKLLPLIERPTSWKCCCGMLDVFMGSDR